MRSLVPARVTDRPPVPSDCDCTLGVSRFAPYRPVVLFSGVPTVVLASVVGVLTGDEVGASAAALVVLLGSLVTLQGTRRFPRDVRRRARRRCAPALCDSREHASVSTRTKRAVSSLTGPLAGLASAGRDRGGSERRTGLPRRVRVVPEAEQTFGNAIEGLLGALRRVDDEAGELDKLPVSEVADALVVVEDYLPTSLRLFRALEPGTRAERGPGSAAEEVESHLRGATTVLTRVSESLAERRAEEARRTRAEGLRVLGEHGRFLSSRLAPPAPAPVEGRGGGLDLERYLPGSE